MKKKNMFVIGKLQKLKIDTRSYGHRAIYAYPIIQNEVDLSLFVHRSFYPKGYEHLGWVVSEYKTGNAVCLNIFGTRKSVVEEVLENILRQDMEIIRRNITKILKSRGVANGKLKIS